ncbi:DUF5403 family protein [Lentzea chajnantorensis]
MAQVYKDCASTIAHLDGVTGAVVDAAAPILARARANLANRRDDGSHEVVLRLGSSTDAFVELVGPAPLALERGHYARDGSWVEGAHILRDAVQPGG